jgi:Flp pilus assembly protein TadB
MRDRLGYLQSTGVESRSGPRARDQTGGGDVLSQDERRRLARLEEQLRLADPALDARMAGRTGRRFPLALVLVAALAWAVTVSMMAAGWWVGAAAIGLAAIVMSAVLAYRRRSARRAAAE